MTSINPLSGALLQSAELQKRQSLDKAQQLRRRQQSTHHVDADLDEDVVENSPDSQNTDPDAKRRQKRPPSDGHPHELDIRG